MGQGILQSSGHRLINFLFETFSMSPHWVTHTPPKSFLRMWPWSRFSAPDWGCWKVCFSFNLCPFLGGGGERLIDLFSQPSKASSPPPFPSTTSDSTANPPPSPPSNTTTTSLTTSPRHPCRPPSPRSPSSSTPSSPRAGPPRRPSKPCWNGGSGKWS